MKPNQQRSALYKRAGVPMNQKLPTSQLMEYAQIGGQIGNAARAAVERRYKKTSKR